MDLEQRVNGYLDQLENPNLKKYEVEAIKDKIDYLKGLQMQE